MGWLGVLIVAVMLAAAGLAYLIGLCSADEDRQAFTGRAVVKADAVPVSYDRGPHLVQVMSKGEDGVWR